MTVILRMGILRMGILRMLGESFAFATRKESLSFGEGIQYASMAVMPLA